MRKTIVAIGAVAAMFALPKHLGAQVAELTPELRKAHAVLLGLDLGSVRTSADGSADVYYSIVDNPNAPRLVTRLEIAINPCRSRVLSGLQFPGKWASLTLGLLDLGRIEDVGAYATVDDMIAETNKLPIGDAAVRHVVLTGEGLYCSSRLSLASADEQHDETCGNRVDLSMIDDEQQVQGEEALAVIAESCKVEALKRP